MRENLLKKQPTWGLRRAQGTGQKSATPATLTKVILVLLTMLLLPSAAWGQITVAGNSPDQSGNITGTGITGTGTVTFNAETSTLTLNNATIDGSISYSGTDALTIALIGGNTMNCGSSSKAFVSTNEVSLSFSTNSTDNGSLTISDGSSYNFDASDISTFSSKFTQISCSEGSRLVAVSVDKGMIYVSNSYRINIGGVTVTTLNADKIEGVSETGTVKYVHDATNNSGTLYLTGVTISETGTPAISIPTSLLKLTINIQGSNSIETTGNIAVIMCNRLTGTNTVEFSGTGSLTLQKDGDPGLTSSNLESSYKDGLVPTYLPEGTTSLATATKAVIAKPYGLTVAGVEVTSANNTNILNDDNKTVSFTPAEGASPATLTLTGAILKVSTNEGAAIESSLDNLVVNLVDGNTVQAQAGSQTVSTFYAFKGNGSNTITFSTNVQNLGTIGGQLLEQYVSKDVTLAYQEGLGLSRQGDSFTIGVITYGITIGETIVTYFNKEDVFGDSKVSFTPATIGADQSSIPATLTLNGASIGQIKMTAAGDLTLHFVGGNTITVENVSDIPIQGYNSSGTLEFSTSNNKTDVLTIVGIENTNRIVDSWFHAPSISATGYEADWAVVSTGATGNTHHISKNNKYDLWINGERFCDTNLAPYSGIAFDPETSTLTYAYTSQDHVIYSGLPSPLTIKMGNSQLKAIVFGSPDTTQPITATSGTLSIVKYSEGSSENCEFTLEGDGTNSVIRGFTSVDFGDFVVLSDGAKYNNGQLVDASGVAMTAATLSTNPVLPKPEMYSESSDETIQLGLTNSTVSYGTLKYSIVYADNSEGVTDAVYEDDTPPTINKPATVTAWLQLNDMKSEVAKGKYFGLKNEAITIAEGDIYDSANPLDVLTPAIEEGDGIYCTYSSEEDEVVACDYENAKLEAKGTGSGLVFVFAEPTDPDNIQTYVLNNDGLELTVNVGGNLNEIFAANNNYGTFYNTSTTTYAVPEGMKAYVITGADPKTGKVTTAETTVLPPNTPVLLEKGSAKAFTYIPATSGTAPSGNILLYTGNTDVQATEGSNLYVLYNDKFVKVTTDTRILSQKCYLKLNTSSSGTRSYYDIDGSDGTTALREVKSEGVKGEKWDDGEWYTLQGQRVTKPTKPGLYILNGKKVVIK